MNPWTRGQKTSCVPPRTPKILTRDSISVDSSYKAQELPCVSPEVKSAVHLALVVLACCFSEDVSCGARRYLAEVSGEEVSEAYVATLLQESLVPWRMQNQTCAVFRVQLLREGRCFDVQRGS